MENRPHGREKNVSNGSAGVHKTGKAGGSGPVGTGTGRTGASNQGPKRAGMTFQATGNGGSSGGTRGGLGKLLVPVVIILLLIFAGKGFLGGGAPDMGGSDYSGSFSSGQTASSSSLSTSGQSYSGSSSSTSGADLTVSSLARDKRVVLKGNNQDTVTIMVYMCGTDLESRSAMATRDLQEMLKANLSDKVNLIIETGGCKQWQNNVISSSVNQIYQVKDGGLVCLEENVGTASMTDPDNLADFIDYCQKSFPADRNMLILWDHGGGSLTGYGYDEKNASSSSMTLTKINSALKKADCVFDTIGFDACLMATLETALVCNEYADYLLASEETEPGTGWYYTDWLNALSKNTSIPTVELGEKLIDTYMTSVGSSKVTLSLIDLAELQGTVPEAFSRFASSTGELVKSDYAAVSNARAGTRQFAQSSQINQVDLVDLAQRIGTPEAKELAAALKGCIKYNRTNISNANGVSIYFPYENKTSLNSAVSVYNSLGMDSEYTDCIRSFASLSTGGQMAGLASTGGYTASASGSSGMDLLGTLLGSYTGSSSSSAYSGGASALTSLLGGFTGSTGSASAGTGLDMNTVLSLLGGFSGRSMPEDLAWVDTDLIAASAESIASQYIDPSHITLSEVNGGHALTLTDDEWNLIQTVELNVFVDDGEGYIDLGLDNTFTWLDASTLDAEYDGSWLTVNGQVCAYYMESDTQNEDGSWVTVGRIPAILDGQFVNLKVVFDSEHPNGIITGAWPLYKGETETMAKGDLDITEGASLQLLCDYYDYDGNYEDSYKLGEPFTVGSSGLELAYLNLADTNCSVTYRLTDIYGASYWTPAYLFSTNH
ncbi:MAG: clostripain-related cysteine peptidase [Oscillospiraceae bacterium]|nr:clostripain-related cysteine peptidase [Oscillospiraceae bacterium]